VEGRHFFGTSRGCLNHGDVLGILQTVSISSRTMLTEIFRTSLLERSGMCVTSTKSHRTIITWRSTCRIPVGPGVTSLTRNTSFPVTLTTMSFSATKSYTWIVRRHMVSMQWYSKFKVAGSQGNGLSPSPRKRAVHPWGPPTSLQVSSKFLHQA